MNVATTRSMRCACLITLGIRTRDLLPGAYIQFLRVAGTEWADPIVDEALIDGPLSQMIRALDAKLASHNRTTVEFSSSDREVRAQDYPTAALQQLTRNAIMHRTYEATNAPIRIYWFDDRIELTSPGGPFGAVTIENFGVPGVTDYRNPNIAEALRVLGFVQRFGFGIQLAKRELEKNGNRPLQFDLSQGHVLCRLFKRGPKQ